MKQALAGLQSALERRYEIELPYEAARSRVWPAQ
jgi:hypothetical protein